MSSIIKHLRDKKGFTLVELLVVIAIIALLVAIVLPAINNALLRGRMLALSANGRSIHQAIFAKGTEGIYTTTSSAWMESDSTDYDPANSSDYFNYLIETNVMDVGFNFFAAPGIPTADDETEFESGKDGDACNAWCMALDIDDSTTETLPVLFLKNLYIANYNDGALYTPNTAENNVPTPLEPDLAPFGTKGFVFITKGGAGFSLFRDDLNADTNFKRLFNVLQRDGTTQKDVDVARPGGEETPSGS